MIFRQKISLKLLLTCISLFFFAGFARSQSKLERKIDVQFENTSLVNAIKTVSTLSEVNFTYDPSIIPGKTINRSFHDQSVKYILTDILSGLEISFVELSGQIILYRSDEGLGFLPGKIIELSPEEPPAEEPILVKTTVLPPKKTIAPIADTIFIHHYDTVYLIRHDTIIQIQTDTLVVETIKVDTVILQDTATIFDKIYLNQVKGNHKAWFSTELLFSYQPDINYTITDDDNQLFSESLSERITISKVQGYSIMANMNAQFSRFSIQTGLGINQLSQHFEHINESFGGFTKNDTIETYYTIQNTDTNWVYVTEEKYIETSELIKNVSKVNSQSLVIPLMLGYSARVKNFSFELCGGFYAEIPLQREISVYFDTTNFAMSEEYNIDNLRLKTRNLSFSYSASLSINYLLDKDLCFVVRPYYYANITSLYRKGEAIQQKNNYAGIYVGLRYYFMRNDKNKRN